jgi:hypothetical protein
MKTATAFCLCAIFALAGCRSRMITVKLTNSSSQPLSTIIVDYPSATFGKDRLAPGETFVSQIRITDVGRVKVQFTDAKGSTHTHTGPEVRPEEMVSLFITLDQNTATVSRDGPVIK